MVFAGDVVESDGKHEDYDVLLEWKVLVDDLENFEISFPRERYESCREHC